MASLDIYDTIPHAMKRYLSHYSWTFSKNACEYAVSLIKGLKPMEKAEVDNLLSSYGVEIENKGGYDYVYIANMAKSDYWGSSIEDDKHLALFIKDTCDDKDASDGEIMRCWYAKMVARGKPVEWEDIL